MKLLRREGRRCMDLPFVAGVCLEMTELLRREEKIGGAFPFEERMATTSLRYVVYLQVRPLRCSAVS